MSRVPSLRRRPGRRALAFLSIATTAAFIVTLFASPYYVNGTSMESSLAPGELLLVERMPVASVQRGEIVLFQPPITSPSPLFIKRVIGLPGETVAIHDGKVYINGAMLNEPYLPAGVTTDTDDPDFQVTVPAGSVFVLGDHRSASWDSRIFGTVKISAIVGRAWVALSPTATFSII